MGEVTEGGMEELGKMGWVGYPMAIDPRAGPASNGLPSAPLPIINNSAIEANGATMAIDQVESDLIRYLVEKSERYVMRLIEDSNQRLDRMVQSQQKLKEEIMASFNQYEAALARQNEILDRVLADVQGQRAEIQAQKVLIEELKAQVEGMGLTTEQEAVLLAGLEQINQKAQMIDDMVPEAPPAPTPTEPTPGT